LRFWRFSFAVPVAFFAVFFLLLRKDCFTWNSYIVLVGGAVVPPRCLSPFLWGLSWLVILLLLLCRSGLLCRLCAGRSLVGCRASALVSRAARFRLVLSSAALFSSAFACAVRLPLSVRRGCAGFRRGALVFLSSLLPRSLGLGLVGFGFALGRFRRRAVAVVRSGFVGVCGGRSVDASAPSRFGASLRLSGLSLLVGCASGADAGAALGFRLGGGVPVVFSRSVLFPRLPVRAALALRSALFVQSCAAVGAPVVGFVPCPCPVGLVPSRRWVSSGSGS
jgi:hypothetical protein